MEKKNHPHFPALTASLPLTCPWPPTTPPSAWRQGTQRQMRGCKVSDWTAGYLAVTDAWMKEIWRLVPNGARVRIGP